MEGVLTMLRAYTSFNDFGCIFSKKEEKNSKTGAVRKINMWWKFNLANHILTPFHNIRCFRCFTCCLDSD